MTTNLSLEDEEQVTTFVLNMRSGPGVGYKIVLVLPAWTILWPQRKIPSWVNGKLVTQEGKSASEWVKVGVLTPLGGEQYSDSTIGYCWIGTEKAPKFISTVKAKSLPVDPNQIA